MTEVPQEGYEFVDASCYAIEPGDPEIEGSSQGRASASRALAAALDGESVSFRVDDRFDEYQCEFINAPISAESTEIWAWKVIDADGDLDTVDDQTAGEGWLFELELWAGIIDEAFPVTNSDGGAYWRITFGPDGASAIVYEPFQNEDFELFGAACFKFTDDDPVEGFSQSRIAASNEVLVGELDGDMVEFRVEPGFPYGCFFYNAPSPEGNVGGDTATPPSNTLPPTDTGRPASIPNSGSWGAMFVVLAAILAAALVSVLVLRTSRTAFRRR